MTPAAKDQELKVEAKLYKDCKCVLVTTKLVVWVVKFLQINGKNIFYFKLHNFTFVLYK